MPNFKKQSSSQIWVTLILVIIMLGFIWYFQWELGLVFTVIAAASFYYSFYTEKKTMERIEKYITKLSYRLKNVGDEALLQMPFGIVLFDENYKVDWANPYMNQFSKEKDSLIGESLIFLSDEFTSKIKENKKEFWFEFNGYQYQTLIKKEERLLYIFDRTKHVELKQLYHNDETTIAIIYLDNYEEITQNMDDAAKSMLNSTVTSVLNNWSSERGLYLKRTSQERFVGVGTKKILEGLEKENFDILDKVRDISGEHTTSITLSIGIGTGNVTLPELGNLAQSSLDLALGRGGDQVAIKDDGGKVRFYGGKTNPMEKRTRVRARVISHALRDLVKVSDNVIIMGHKSPDMDALGSAIGILNIAKTNNVDGYIVFDRNDNLTGVASLVEYIEEEEAVWDHLISPDLAEELVTTKSLLVVVDTHKSSMVAHEGLLDQSEYKVIIDHHRRGENFIENPTLVYMEPYASSTAELVTELLEYQPKGEKLKILEATALLAGIFVDTKNFTLRTGSRTFDAASYLRSKGADTVLVQELLKEDLDVYIERSNLVERAEIYHDTIAIAAAEPGITYGSILIAKAADTLLTMSKINASFVISERDDGKVGISARSLGGINVQVIMEEMNGGGHLSNAATQLADTSIDEAKQSLKEILDEYMKGRETE